MRQETKIACGRLFDRLAKHPFLCVTGMCVLLFFFGYCDLSGFSTMSYVFAGVTAACLTLMLILLCNIGKSMGEKAVVFLTAAALITGALLLIHSYDNSPALILWFSLFVLAAAAALLRVADMLNERTFIMLMIAAGIMLRFMYVLYTSSVIRQHDVGSFSSTGIGHAGYIEYWYKNGLKLPDFDVRAYWQFYHPPLHHWLMALLLRLLTDIGMPYATACEAIQVLPLLYSSLCMVVCYRIFRIVRLKAMPLVIAMAILCFHPTFVLMGGFYNNDLLCVLLMLLSVLFALRWYREPTLRRILPIALCVGFGMMSKLSGWMVAPAIAVIFLYVFVKNIKSWLKFLGQFAIFGVICAPLGLWWQVRNLLTFQIPLTYVPKLGENDPQFVGAHSVAERLFDFGNGQLSYVYDAFGFYGAPYYEYNPTLGLVKTSLFDECAQAINDTNFPQIHVTGPILFWIGAALGLLCFVAFIVSMLSKKSGVDGVTRAFFGIFAVTMLVSYYIFCFEFPLTCTMNIRYCVPLIPLFAMGLGLLLQRFSGASLPQKLLRYTAYALTAAFAVSVCVVYTQIGLPAV